VVSAVSLELTDIFDSPGLQQYRRQHERDTAAARGQATPGDHQHAEEVTGNVAMTCRYYGISRQVDYTWLRRCREHGVDGLRDRSRSPHHSPRATHVDVVGKILYLRQNYHFGPGKISMYLKPYHDVEVSQSGVWRILGTVP